MHTITLYTHTIHYFYICIQFVRPTACLLPVRITSHSELLTLQFSPVWPVALLVEEIWGCGARVKDIPAGQAYWSLVFVIKTVRCLISVSMRKEKYSRISLYKKSNWCLKELSVNNARVQHMRHTISCFGMHHTLSVNNARVQNMRHTISCFGMHHTT
jgi:hypothetical protein